MGEKTPKFNPESGMINNVDFLQKISCTDLPKVTTNKRQVYYNVPAGFDIEVSSFYQYGEKKACMYIWQFGILNWVTYGRTWDEFIVFIKVLSTILGLDENTRLPVYIQNLAYEFQFMRKWFEWDKIFFLEERRPVYAITGGIEFRCSLKLSGKSLERMGKDLQKYKVEKKVGDLDYQMLRLPCTPVSSTELGYCENDIRVLLAYIQEKIETDGDVSNIPMTNTGYVRNFCRKNCFKKYSKYKRLIGNLTLTSEEYVQLKRGFMGGFTHANARYSGKILENVGSYDFTSSYPAVMLSEKFPMSKSRLVNDIHSKEEFDNILNNYCCLFDVTFYNIVPKLNYDHPISRSKAYKVIDAVTDNGRIVSAERMSITCTELDFFTYRDFYDWDKMEISCLRIYDKAYLPKPFFESILELYERKTVLKGIQEEVINYLISKGMLNAAYGMCVTDIVRDEISYDLNGYSKKKPELKGAIEKYNNAKKRFLFYPWGVWVTAYARYNLFTGIKAFGDDYVYADTDSIKALNYHKHLDYINQYNANIAKKLAMAANFHDIDKQKFSPLNIKGVPKPIGIWDFEGVYDRFKTIGAKRYLTQRGSKYELTVAGLNKRKACEFLVQNFSNPFDGLSDNLVVPEEYSGRLISTYVDEECSGMIVDYTGRYGEYNELSYIHMSPSEYELTLSHDYKQFLNAIRGIKEDSW